MPEKIIRQDLVSAVSRKYIDYAMSVIVSRALPDVRDGLKPVHRRILHAMNEGNNNHSGPYRKSARSVGDTMGKYHPHGDSSIYEAMVNLAQDFGTRYPLIDMHGNSGSLDGDPAAAMRYTESRLTRIADTMLDNIDKDTVELMNNFDDTLTEPKYLPTLLPNLLMNGCEGIAVGMATKMPPHNLTEVLDAVDYIIAESLEGREADFNHIMSIVKGPDFPLGGVIVGTQGIHDAFTTGKGRIIVRSVYDIEETKNRTNLVITEIPYQVNKATLVDKIDTLRKNGMTEIREVRDESNKQGVRVVVELKKDCNVQLLINKLLKQTQMQVAFNVNNTVLVEDQPRVVNLQEMLEYYLVHAMDVVRRRSQYDLNKASARLHIVEGILWAIHEENLDEVIHTIRAARTTEEAIRNLMALSDTLTETQAKSISEMRLRQLTTDNEEKYLDEQSKLTESIMHLTDIVENQVTLLTTLRQELSDLKAKYGDERRTKIVLDSGNIDEIDLIEDETLVVTYSTDGIIKTVEEKEYRSTRRGAKGVKAGEVSEDEAIKFMLTVNSKEDLLFFTTLGRCHVLKAYKISKVSRTARGKSINNYLALDEGEQIVSMITADLADKENSFALVTRNGIIKRLSFEDLSTRRNVTKVINFREDDMLIAVQVLKDDEQLMMTTACGMSIRFKGSDVRAMGRTAAGVKGITLREHDYVVDAVKVEDDATLLTVTRFGLGKRTLVSEYSCQSRGGKGVTTHKLNEQTGELVCANVVNDTDELFVATANGQVIRIDASTIRTCGRSTSGVKIINLSGDDYIVSVSRNNKEEEVEGE